MDSGVGIREFLNFFESVAFFLTYMQFACRSARRHLCKIYNFHQAMSYSVTILDGGLGTELELSGETKYPGVRIFKLTFILSLSKLITSICITNDL